MIFNIAKNSIQNRDTIDVPEISFWEYYMRTTAMMRNIYLTDSEFRVFSYILAGDKSISYFKGDNATILCKKLKLKRPNLCKIRDRLLSYKFLERGVGRGDFIITTSLGKLQEFVKTKISNGETMEIAMPLNITT